MLTLWPLPSSVVLRCLCLGRVRAEVTCLRLPRTHTVAHGHLGKVVPGVWGVLGVRNSSLLLLLLLLWIVWGLGGCCTLDPRWWVL